MSGRGLDIPDGQDGNKIELDQFSGSAIAVDSQGNAFDHYTREKEAIIRTEALNAQKPMVEIDLEKILAQPEGYGISVVIQDFGLPPRTINIQGDFTTIDEVGGQARDEEHYSGAPKVLVLSTVTSGGDATYSFDDKGLPFDRREAVKLARGESMLFAHEGRPSDERIGYIESNSWGWELIALLSRDYYGAPDFSENADSGLRDGYVPFIGLRHTGKTLQVFSLDNAHAEIQYQQVRSLADEITTPDIPEAELSDREEILADISDGATDLLDKLLSDHKVVVDELSRLAMRVTELEMAGDSMETLLAGGRRKLHEARAEAQRLEWEVKRLKAAANTEPGNDRVSDGFISDLLGDKPSKLDPHGHCAALGIAPNFVFQLDPEIAKKYIKGVHRALVMQFHSDGQAEGNRDDEAMKRVNSAVDSLFNRIDSGFWGRN